MFRLRDIAGGGWLVDRRQIPRPGFLDRCEYLSYVGGGYRVEAFFCIWDALHGEIETFDRHGRRTGVLDTLTGEEIKPSRKGRRIRV